MVTIPNLTDEQWAEYAKRLTLRAQKKLLQLYWRGLRLDRGGAVPGGLEATDFAAQAVAKALDGTRVWDTGMDFYEFLCSVVDSDLNHLCESLENRSTRRLAQAEGGGPAPPEGRPPARPTDPAAICADEEVRERFRASVLGAVEGDKMAEEVFLCLEAEVVKPAEMAELLGLPVKDINNAQKRLKRAVEGVLKTHRRG